MDIEQIQKLTKDALEAHENSDYSQAESLFLEALYLLDDKENQLYQTLVYGLGINYALQENYDGARSCFEEGRLNAQKAGNIPFELEMLHQLVKVCRKTEDQEAAELLVEEEILYRKKYVPQDKVGLTAAYYEAAMIYLSSRNFRLGEERLQSAWEQAQETGEEENTAAVWIGMGDFYLAKKDYQQALAAYEASKKIYEHHSNKKALETLHLRRKNVQRLKNEKKEADEEHLET